MLEMLSPRPSTQNCLTTSWRESTKLFRSRRQSHSLESLTLPASVTNTYLLNQKVSKTIGILKCDKLPYKLPWEYFEITIFFPCKSLLWIWQYCMGCKNTVSLQKLFLTQKKGHQDNYQFSMACSYLSSFHKLFMQINCYYYFVWSRLYLHKWLTFWYENAMLSVWNNYYLQTYKCVTFNDLVTDYCC